MRFGQSFVPCRRRLALAQRLRVFFSQLILNYPCPLTTCGLMCRGRAGRRWAWTSGRYVNAPSGEFVPNRLAEVQTERFGRSIGHDVAERLKDGVRVNLTPCSDGFPSVKTSTSSTAKRF